MPLPPHTPQDVLDGLAKRPDVRKRIARGWMTVGGLVLLFIIAMAIAHYGFGMPVHDGDTGKPSTPSNTLMMFVLVGGGGAFFLVIGVLLNRWKMP